ncbi:unnamed protein product [Orchesella dallaii]|uniref:Voltage-dependent calcium channel gamma-5 subunit n=1 Tax=Orchesella dallaii TaxID=48710 RepID=A0ABP1RF93_9HEXA
MPCSAVTLSLATIAAVVSTALLAIAFSTDNWVRIDVKRTRLAEKIRDENITPEELQSNPIYYSRTEGLFRICFPNDRPKGKAIQAQLYLSPTETYCMNIDYYLSGDENSTADFTPDEHTKLYMGRGMICLFILAFVFVFIAFWTGVAGCWRRSSGNITATAILMLLTCLFSAGGMGLWHGVEYYETEKLTGSNYFKDWPQPLKDHSMYYLDWSFYLSWLSVGFSLVSAILFAGAATCLSRENDKMAYAQNQYFMTVYPQKQPGYAYGYAYPTPYAYAAQSQQYPYNY